METLNTWLTQAAAAAGPLLPRAAAALAILVVAWLAARLVRSALLRAAARFDFDQKLNSPGLATSLAGVGSALVWLLALPALLGALELQALLTPVNAMMTRLLSFIPNLMASAVVLGIGVLVAGIARQLVSGLLRAAGSEQLAQRLGMKAALGEGGLAGIGGMAVFALLLLPTVVAALQPLGLDAITLPLSRLLENLINFIPKLMAAAIVVGLAAVIARLLSTVVTALAAGAGLDRLPGWLGLTGQTIAGRSASEWSGVAVMTAVLVTALSQACELLGLPVLTEAVRQLGAALFHTSMAALILLVGLILANAAGKHIEEQATSAQRGRTLSWLTRGALMFFAAALALHQAGLPAVIVTIAFGAVVGGIAIGLAIAVGVGGGPVAARLLERAVSSFDNSAAANGTAEADNPPAAATGDPVTKLRNEPLQGDTAPPLVPPVQQS